MGSTIVTDADIRNQVLNTLVDFVDEYDIDGIVREIINTYGLVDLDAVPHDEYWDIVQAHEVH